jgi:hypothetical protein
MLFISALRADYYALDVPPSPSDNSPMENTKHPKTEPNWSIAHLTKREYFAAMAMQGLLANGETITKGEGHALAEYAIYQADELINSLNDDA